MKPILFALAVLICATAMLMPTGGCATFQAITAPTPTTPVEQLDAMQRDLDTAKAGANLAHELGKWQDVAEWTKVQTGFANAQTILASVRVAVVNDPTLTQQAVTDALNAAAKAVHDAKAQAKQ